MNNLPETATPQNPTEIKPFKPTGAMQKWLDKAVELMSTNKTEISRECGVDRTMWYDWLDTPGFEDWYYAEYRRRRQIILPELDAIGMAEARKGNILFWKEMNRKAGDGEVVVSPTNAIQINFNGRKYIKER